MQAAVSSPATPHVRRVWLSGPRGCACDWQSDVTVEPLSKALTPSSYGDCLAPVAVVRRCGRKHLLGS